MVDERRGPAYERGGAHGDGETRVAALLREIAGLREQGARDRREQEILARRCATLEDELVRLRAEIARHERFIHDQHREVLDATSTLHTVLRSRSWRLTAPLRASVLPFKRSLQRLRSVARQLSGREGAAPGGPVRKAVLFVSGCPGDARRYRCDHALECLGTVGVTGDVALQGQIDLEAEVECYAVFVLHRVAHDLHVERFLRAAARARKPVVFDTDDWVFDLAAVAYVAALADMSADDQALYRDGLTRYRSTLSRCGGALVSTEPLRERAGELLDNVHVAGNVASREMTELSRLARERRAVVAARRAADGDVVLGYFSGTPTHARDFAEAVPALVQLMDAHPRVRLLLVGHIDTPRELHRFAGRIAHLPLVPWQRLPGIMADVDVNLAPLERDNVFTECKSAIKYLEAALVGVPTVATPLPDFRRMMEHGRGGLLASSGAQWSECLTHLVESPALRAELGAHALADVERRFTTSVSGEHYVRQLCRAARCTPVSDPLIVNWIVRAPIAGTGGGYLTIFRLADALGRAGHHVRVYVEPIAHLEGRSDEQIRAFVADGFGAPSVEVVVGHDDIQPADATIATNWPTAFTVARHPGSLFKLYFIQDFEPEFYAATDPLYRQAEETYALPLQHVTIGRSLAQRMARLTGKPCASIDFAVDSQVFRVDTRPGERAGPPRILFFARPGLPRRGYGLGIEALRRVVARRPDVRLAAFGASDAEMGAHGLPIENLGVLGHAEIAREMNAAHVLLCFSLSANISWVPLQGMACGCAVVEADVPGVREMIEDGRVCALAAPEPDAVAATLLALLSDDDRRCRIASAAADWMRERSFATSEKQFETILRERCFARLERAPQIEAGSATLRSAT
jgi:glycosyltransferase involved in cell wall biosynthesis